MTFNVEKFDEFFAEFSALLDETPRCLFSIDFFQNDGRVYQPRLFVDILPRRDGTDPTGSKFVLKLHLCYSLPEDLEDHHEFFDEREQLKKRILFILENDSIKVKILRVDHYDDPSRYREHTFE